MHNHHARLRRAIGAAGLGMAVAACAQAPNSATSAQPSNANYELFAKGPRVPPVPPPVAGPGITNVTPATGQVGDRVTITGTGFAATATGNTVTFGGVPATVSPLSTATTLFVTVPAGAVPGPVRVAVGTVVSPPFTFTLLPSPIVPPVLTAVEPVSGQANQLLMITGSGFPPPGTLPIVTIGGIPATVLDTSTPNALFVVVPPTATAGLIAVTTASGTATIPITLAPPSANLPTLTAVTPASGPVGATISVSGTNLATASAFAINGVPAPISNLTNTGFQVQVPAGATTGAITVTTANGLGRGPTFAVEAPVPYPNPGAFSLTNFDIPSIVQLLGLPKRRMRIEVTADTHEAFAPGCPVTNTNPTLASLEARMTASSPTYEPMLGLRGHAGVFLQNPDGSRGTSVVVGGKPLDIPDMAVPVDEPVAVGTDAAGNVWEIVWIGGPPIVRVQLADWTTDVVPGATLMVEGDLQTYDKRTGVGIDQWNVKAPGIEVP